MFVCFPLSFPKLFCKIWYLEYSPNVIGQVWFSFCLSSPLYIDLQSFKVFIQTHIAYQNMYILWSKISVQNVFLGTLHLPRYKKYVYRGGAVGWGTGQQAWMSRFDSRWGRWDWLIIPDLLWPWSQLSLDRNNYQGRHLGGKGGRYLGLTTLSSSCADCQLSAHLSACPGLYRYC